MPLSDERQALLEAAIELLDKKGYKDTTVQDVVERAGLTKYSFYRYFKSKEEVLHLIHEHLINDMLIAAESAVHLNCPVEDKLRLVVSNVTANMQYRKAYVRVFFSEVASLSPENLAKTRAKRDKLFHFVEQMIRGAIRSGELRPDQDPAILAMGLFGMCNWMYQWFKPGERLTAAEIGEIFLRIFMEGTRTRTLAEDASLQLAASSQPAPVQTPYSLVGKVVLIIGGGRGVGRALAFECAQHGATVAVLDTCIKDAQAVVDALTREGYSASAWQADTTDRVACEAVAARILHQLDRIDVLVHNTGTQQPVPFLNMPQQSWDQVLSDNLKGVYNCTGVFLPDMVRQGQGNMITVAPGVRIRDAQAGEAHSAAARGAMIEFTRSIAQEFGRQGIRANVVVPGLLNADGDESPGDSEARAYRERSALGRIGTPQDVAAAVLFLSSDASAFISGEVIKVCGGYLTT